MKAKTEKEAIRFVTTTLGMSLLDELMDSREKILLRGTYTTKEIMKKVIGSQTAAARKEFTDEQWDRFLLIKRAMETLAKKLVHCENEEMLAHVVHVIQGINTGQIGILADDQEMIEN